MKYEVTVYLSAGNGTAEFGDVSRVEETDGKITLYNTTGRKMGVFYTANIDGLYIEEEK